MKSPGLNSRDVLYCTLSKIPGRWSNLGKCREKLYLPPLCSCWGEYPKHCRNKQVPSTTGYSLSKSFLKLFGGIRTGLCHSKVCSNFSAYWVQIGPSIQERLKGHTRGKYPSIKTVWRGEERTPMSRTKVGVVWQKAKDCNIGIEQKSKKQILVVMPWYQFFKHNH